MSSVSQKSLFLGGNSWQRGWEGVPLPSHEGWGEGGGGGKLLRKNCEHRPDFFGDILEKTQSSRNFNYVIVFL